MSIALVSGHRYRNRKGIEFGPMLRLGNSGGAAFYKGRCAESAEEFIFDHLGRFDSQVPSDNDLVEEVKRSPQESAFGVYESGLTADHFAILKRAIEKPDIKARIADAAKDIVAGARRSAYGTPEQNFERIARFWQAYFENTGRGAVKITAADVSPLMRLMKEARLCETPDHYDSHVDLVGYTLTGAEVNGVKSSA
jgi:hypothetical protein